MHTIRVHARGVLDPEEMANALAGQADTYSPDSYAITYYRPNQSSHPNDYDVTVQVDGLVTHEGKSGTMDMLFEDVIQVIVNFYANDGSQFKLTESLQEGIEFVLYDYNVVCTCGCEAVTEAEQILKDNGK